MRPAPAGASANVTYRAPNLGRRVPLIEPLLVHFPHQWLWDSCAHAIALAHVEPQAAQAEVGALLAAQDGAGFIPHLIWDPARLTWLDRLARRHFQSPVGSRLTQTPGVAEAAEATFRATGDTAWLRQALPGIERYYAWLRAQRRDRKSVV
jgi:glycogen debranching enzyme